VELDDDIVGIRLDAREEVDPHPYTQSFVTNDLDEPGVHVRAPRSADAIHGRDRIGPHRKVKARGACVRSGHPTRAKAERHASGLLGRCVVLRQP
jgi:hypothetical protein